MAGETISQTEIFREEIIAELTIVQRTNPRPMDIIVVVHDQPLFTRECIDHVYNNTHAPRIFVHDNASQPETRELLEDMKNRGMIYHLQRSEENLGFIKPNNQLWKLTTTPYVVALNSDTKVFPDWDLALAGYLDENSNTAIVGFGGGILDHEAKGRKVGHGKDIDFVGGWCLCVRRESLGKQPLFDEINLKFAYGEDSDLCLRMREKGHDVYALHLNWVVHLGGKTSTEVAKEIGAPFHQFVENNHAYLQRRWERYLPPYDFRLQS